MKLLRPTEDVEKDESISSLMVEARRKLLPFADPSWISHSPQLFKGLEKVVERIATRRQQIAARSQPATPSLGAASVPVTPHHALFISPAVPAAIPSPSQQQSPSQEGLHSAAPSQGAGLPTTATGSESRVPTQSVTTVCVYVQTAHLLILCRNLVQSRIPQQQQLLAACSHPPLSITLPYHLYLRRMSRNLRWDPTMSAIERVSSRG